jgi:hypothetical protein
VRERSRKERIESQTCGYLRGEILLIFESNAQFRELLEVVGTLPGERRSREEREKDAGERERERERERETEREREN